MSLTAGKAILLSSAAGGGYEVSRSLRFNSSDSAYLSRTPASAGNRRTWTWAGWVKRSKLSASMRLLRAVSGGTEGGVQLLSGNAIELYDYSGGYTWQLVTSQLFRDVSAWYHLVIAFDTTQGTAANRVSLYVNGAKVSAFSTSSYPSQNFDGLINTTNAHAIAGSDLFFDGYLADIHFIDGQALDPTSFTEVDATTGQLIPKAYTGSFGTNGFWLKFSDNSAATATTLGKDYSPNGNNWTPNNLSVTAGAGNDSLVDTPTSYGTDTGAGGEVRGNYATLNPLDNISADGQCTLSNGNLDVNTGTGTKRVTGTQAFASGKWYWECTFNGTGGARTGIQVTVPDSNHPEQSEFVLSTIGGAGLYTIVNGSFTQVSSAVTVTTGQVVGIGIDADSNISYWYVDGVLKATYNFSSLIPVGSRSLVPVIWNGSGDSLSWSMNFGQRAFAYQTVGSNRPAATYKALCDTNLPAPVVAKPSTVMDVKLYTGNGTSQTISGLGFSPDLVWVKQRSGAQYHTLQDTVRGATNDLYSNATDAESTYAQSLNAFNSDGFTVGSLNWVNQNSQTYVAWTWDAGSSTVSNPDGSITSQVRANASAGFSIVTYSGNSSTATVGHGLNVAPSWIIIKNRTSAYDWIVYANESGTLKQLYLNLTLASSGSGLSLPSSTTFNLPGGGASGSNETGKDYVAYCFAPVAGYSSFGAFEGSGSTQFVYTGFRPKFLIVKCSAGSSSQEWVIKDGARNSYNVANSFLYANAADAEGSSNRDCDFLSNGFSIPGSVGPMNFSGRSYVYAAFAESPFQYARAR